MQNRIVYSLAGSLYGGLKFSTALDEYWVQLHRLAGCFHPNLIVIVILLSIGVPWCVPRPITGKKLIKYGAVDEC